MEDVLEVDETPPDANYPVIAMEAQPVQLLKEIRTPIPATATHAKRVDYEYERAGAPVFSCSPNRWRAGAK